MNIIGVSGNNEQSGILASLREDGLFGQRAELLSACSGSAREDAPARRSGSSSDSVFISEHAMLLAAGLLAPAADQSAPLHDDNNDSLGLYSSSGYSAFARARIAARRARNEAALAGMAVMAPLPPGGDGSEGANDALKAGVSSSASSPSDAAFSVARLQDRLRDLQQELGALENSNMPDALKATQIHNLSSQINRARQDISGLLHRTRS